MLVRRPDQRRRALVGLLGVLLLSIAGAGLVRADGVKLVLLPVDQPGPYFDVTMRPGEKRTFEVEIGDAVPAPLAARTYAADVYTIINGGFGGRLRDEARTGMTTWLDYPTETVQLRAGQAVHRRFTVTVPRDAGPGEYISSLVLENELPIRAGGSVSVDQYVRQAVAVVVTVPGERSPRLAIGAATHEVVAGRSIVSAAVENTGNVRLKPVVGFILLDASGAQVSRTSLQMDTFYARTGTTVEVALAAVLLPGVYTIKLTLDDAIGGARADAAAIPLVVVAAAALPAAVEGGGAELPAVDQVSGPLPVAAVPWITVGLVGILGIGVCVGVGLGARTLSRRGRRRRRETGIR